MAHAWIFLIILIFAKNTSSHPGVFSSETELSRSEKVELQSSEIEIACPFKCACYNGNSNFSVDCSYKKFDAFPIDLHPSVVHLKLVGNNIFKLSFNVTLRKLNSLNAAKNNISEIDSQWINSLIHLDQLDMSENSLTSKSVENIFINTTLISLNLSKNKLSAITDVMVNQIYFLHSLNLSFNEIESISYCSFCDLVHLDVLDLSNNKLSNIHHEWFKNLQNLQILNLKKNNIKFLKNVVFSTLKNLKILDLSQNSIASIGLLSFKGLAQLQYLNLTSNYISHFQDGVFRSLDTLKILDISKNYISNVDNIFANMKNLEFLYLKELNRLRNLTALSLDGLKNLISLDASGSFALDDINLKSFLFVQNLRFLDLSNSNLTHLKMGVFKNLHKIEALKLSGNPWKCDCYLYWLLMWLGEHTNTHLLSPSETYCATPVKLKNSVLLDALDHNMVCTNSSINYYTHKTKFKIGSPALLECKVDGNPFPSITWITPQKEAFYWEGFTNKTKQTDSLQAIVLNSSDFDVNEANNRFNLMENGNLAIQNVERGDGGFYICVAANPLSSVSVSIRLTLDYEYMVHIKIVSVLVGLATSFGFLLLTLISVLIKMILKHFGVRCPCYNGNASPRTQQIKKILESMEHYKKQQLDRLRDNYNGQVQRIKDNCMQQMERLRESYSSQAERLRDIKEYGTLQIDRIRENYYFQVQRVRDYSASQIVRLRENYIYQRNRIRKFSAHHLYKLRENYKVQQQHLNKILENFNIESCRNVCQRTDSVVFEPDLNLENVLVPKICLQTITKGSVDSNDNSSQLSAYFTPDEAGSEISGHESDDNESFLNLSKLCTSPSDLATNVVITDSNSVDIPPDTHNDCPNSEKCIFEGSQNANETIV